MTSERDPGRAAMEAEEEVRMLAAQASDRRQEAARRARNAALAGDENARKALADDYAAVNARERRRAGRR